MKKLTLIIIILFSFKVYSQERKFRPILWTQHEKNTDVAGISVGFFQTDYKSSNHLNRTFGLRIVACPISPLYFLAPNAPIITGITQKVYGINITSGTFEATDVHGISATIFLNNLNKVNGISFAGVGNSIQKGTGLFISPGGNRIIKGNGITISGMYGTYTQNFNGLVIGTTNYAETIEGVQIGIYNSSKNLKGFQIGLWNKNQNRSFPIINWAF